MAVRALIVDDSGFFCRRLTELLNQDPRIEVVGTAANGREAIQCTQSLKPDVISMDIEMPVMDGITAVRRIMAIQPTPILIFSSLSQEGAQATFDALDAGAMDYLPKNFDDISKQKEEVAKELCHRIWTLGIRGVKKKDPVVHPPKASLSSTKANVAQPQNASSSSGGYEIIAIGASTGGPVALQNILTRLPKDFPIPIVLIQHMPGTFTEAFAKRLDQLCAISVKQAKDGDVLKRGEALLAPGGQQMLVETRGDTLKVKIAPSVAGQNYRPCIDVTFQSIASSVRGNCLALVLTGMGADGRDGAQELKSKGATIWAQDEATSVIYGMPMAIAQAGIADQILSLQDIGTRLATVTK